VVGGEETFIELALLREWKESSGEMQTELTERIRENVQQ